MDNLKYNGKLKWYLMMPIAMIACFAVATIIFYIQDPNWGLDIGFFTVVYTIAVIVFYCICRNRFADEIKDYAVHYGTVQKELISHFSIPYALLDANGKFMWMNGEFGKIVDKDSNYSKSITSIFPEVTKETLDKLGDNLSELHVEYKEKKYCVTLQVMEVTTANKASEVVSELDTKDSLIAVLLHDETDYVRIKQENTDQHLVLSLIYIDNYDEVLETVENAKQSMLLALIDRRINKYFKNAEAVVRRLEKDKYLCIFQYKYLAAMEQDNFSILEDVKNIKMGNELELTLSIGIGVGGNSYTANAEFAHMAIDLALARGGSQAVVKDNSKVSYFGSHGKEFEKSTRVKARVKAQALREIMESRSDVLVMGHSISDADCMGASIGVYCAARELGKPTHIVMNTVTTSMKPVIESFTSSGNYPADMFITSDKAMELLNDQTLVMVVDTNRPSYVDCPELLKKNRNNVVVIDHHRMGEETIANPILSYIEPYASSASEMIAEILQYFSEKIHISATEADAIYAGILIDTNNFMTKTGVRTFEAAAFLRRNGAEVTRVRKMLRENMETYKARAEVVRNASVYRGAFAISVFNPEGVESPTVVCAKAANELLNIVGIKASFVITDYNKKTYVSSRSIDEINVHLIMERLGGGGHLNVAGAQVEDSSADEVKQQICDIIDEMLEKGEIRL